MAGCRESGDLALGASAHAERGRVPRDGRAWRLGHVIRDEVGFVYAWTDPTAEGEWVMLQVRDPADRYLISTVTESDRVEWPVEILGQPIATDLP